MEQLHVGPFLADYEHMSWITGVHASSQGLAAGSLLRLGFVGEIWQSVRCSALLAALRACLTQNVLHRQWLLCTGQQVALDGGTLLAQ